MALTRDFKQTISERARRDPSFATALLDEAATLFLNGEPTHARLILRDLVNATIGFETPDPECDVALVANESRRGKADIVLNNSLAFGGYNAVACFAKPDVLPPPADRAAHYRTRTAQEELKCATTPPSSWKVA